MSGNSAYYEEILILVDGWPWNLSEFDFRTWFAPGSCPQAVHETEIAREIKVAPAATQVSGNRRARRNRKSKKNRKAA
jgi:hypothetical protein